MAGSNPMRRTVQVVDAVAAARGSLTLADIANLVSLPMSTTHRIVNSLVDVGYLACDKATKTYVIGDRLKRVFSLTLGAVSLKTLARPMLVDLAEQYTETSYVTRLTASGIELVDFYLPTHGSRTLVHPGFEFPMHATAAGKSIYAFQAEEVIEAEIAKGFEPFMPNTIADAREMRRELGRVRKLGYAASDLELDMGVLAVAAPVRFGETGVAGSIAICGSKERMLRDHEIAEIGNVLRRVATELSRLVQDDVAAG